MILNLIDSLVDEKQLNSDNDENFLLTIDSLINSLKHLRERIKTIPHDDAHPLNLSKPKIRQPACLSSNNTNERNSPSTATSPATSFPVPPSPFAAQPFFSPFSGNLVSRPIDFSHVFLSRHSGQHDTYTELSQTVCCIGSQRIHGEHRCSLVALISRPSFQNSRNRDNNNKACASPFLAGKQTRLLSKRTVRAVSI